MMRRSAFEGVGGYRPILYSQDYDLWLRLSEKHTVGNLGEPIIEYRVHPGQISSTKVVEQTIAGMAVLAASRLRRAGARDPLETNPVMITRELVLSWGISEDEMDRQLFLAYTARAALALRVGEPGESRGLLEEVFSTLDAKRKRGQRYADAVCVLSRAHLEEGSPFKALRVVVGGLWDSRIGWRSGVRRALRVMFGKRASATLREVSTV